MTCNYYHPLLHVQSQVLLLFTSVFFEQILQTILSKDAEVTFLCMFKWSTSPFSPYNNTSFILHLPHTHPCFFKSYQSSNRYLSPTDLQSIGTDLPQINVTKPLPHYRYHHFSPTSDNRALLSSSFSSILSPLWYDYHLCTDSSHYSAKPRYTTAFLHPFLHHCQNLTQTLTTPSCIKYTLPLSKRKQAFI